jgi:hypothetical protein
MTQHRGRRSEFNEQLRFVKQLVVTTARHDHIRAEKVCMLDNEQISDALGKRFNCVIVARASDLKGR